MMMTAILCFVVFYILAAFTGMLSGAVLAKVSAKPSPVFTLAFGGCLLTAIGMISSVLCAATGQGTAVGAALTVLIALAAGSSGIILSKRRGYEMPRICRPSTATVITFAVAAVIVALQIYGVETVRYEDASVLRPVASATAVYDTGRLFAADPMMLLIGTLSRIIGIHPLRFIYTIAPPVFISMYYLCYYEVLAAILPPQKRIIAFATLAALNIWGYQSERLAAATLLISWFGIWVYLLHGVVNIAAVILIRYTQTERVRPVIEDHAAGDSTEDIPEEWDMNKHRIINARNLAIALGVLAALLIVTVLVLNSKINRLYDATVNLQKQMEEGSKLYEYTGDDGEVKGYLIKGSDGSVTYIGDESAQNDESVAAFIDRYAGSDRVYYIDMEEMTDR